MEFFLASPTTLSNEVAKKPSPMLPSGISAMLMSFSKGFGCILYDTGRSIKYPHLPLGGVYIHFDYKVEFKNCYLKN